MKWIHKNVTITVNVDGLFKFAVNDAIKYADSLKEAQDKIDKALLEQYHLSENEIKILLLKLSNKERGFVEDMMLELNSHSSSPYCELGLSDMQYTFDWKKWRD